VGTEIARPAQPLSPFCPRPHLLQSNFTGRFAERSQLTAWLTQPSEPLLVIVGIGGLGKSDLTWTWMQHDIVGWDLQGSSPELYNPLDYLAKRSFIESQPDSSIVTEGEISAATTSGPNEARVSGLSGILWWSFYDRDADFSAFLRQATKYATEGTFNPDDYTLSQQVDVLLQEAMDRQFLFILDGFERELQAYARSRISYLDNNEEVPQRTLPDRRVIADEARIFLRRLVALRCRSKVLITSQLFPSDLEGDDGRPLPGCHVIKLGRMEPREAVLFMRAQGVRGADTEIEELCGWFDYHPLSLRLISGRIMRDLERPGEIGAIQLSVVLQTIAREYRGIKVVYNGLSEDLQRLACHIAGLDLPITYQDLYTSLASFQMCKNKEELENALCPLLDLGLVTRDQATNRYGMHPVVQAYVRNRFRE